MDRELAVVPDEDIVDLGGWATFARGEQYLAQGRVLRVVWSEEDRQLIGDVVGSTLYHCAIRFTDHDDGGAGEIAATECSCPVGGDCKHCVAILLFNNRRAEAAGDGLVRELEAMLREDSPPRRSEPPEWKRRLDRIVEAGRAATTEAPVALALGFELHRAPTHAYFRPQNSTRLTAEDLPVDAAPRLEVRPLMPGAKANWIKGQLKWTTFTSRSNAGRFDPDQFDWFHRLATLDDGHGTYAYGVGTATISVDSFGTPYLWQLLAQASELGIPLVSADKQISVRLAEQAAFHIDLTAGRSTAGDGHDGGLVVTPDVEIDGSPVPLASVWPIGLDGVYSVERSGHAGMTVTLAPLAERLTPGQQVMLASTSATEIPAEASEDFFDRVLPHLRPRRGGGVDTVVSSDGSVAVPPDRDPHLTLLVRYGRSAGAGHDALSVHLEWSWTYYSPQRTYPLIAVRSERADPRGGRDVTFEAEVLRRVRRIDPSAAYEASATMIGVAVATFTTRILPQLRELDGLEVTVVDEEAAPDFRELEEAPAITVRADATQDRDWFDLGIEVTIEGHVIPFVKLFRALATDQQFLMLENGLFFFLDHPAFDRLRELLAEAAALDADHPENPRLSRYQTALFADFEDLADDVETDARWAELMEGLREVETIPEVAVPETLDAQLRPYQVEGFRWLAFLLTHRLGGILADDMGLGKTLQALALIDWQRAGGAGTDAGATRAPFLVVAPTSVVANWVLEVRKFTPHLTVASVPETTRKRKTSVAEAVADADIVVTSYAVMRLDAEEFAGLDWAGVIFDEAQFMKNNMAKTHRAARMIEAPFRLVITGTPMENSLTDVWSLAAISAPGLLPSAKRFKEDFVRPIESGEDPGRMERLRSRLRPFMLRRTKELVAGELPEKQEQTLIVELEPAHRRLYDTVLQRERKHVLGLLDDFDKNRFAIFRSLTLLRMLALDPGIVEAHRDSGIRSSKLGVLMDQLSDVIAEGHRTLVFSQFTSYLHTVADELTAQGIAYVYLDGSTKDRAQVIEAFRAGEAPVFLISLKAGGFGLTLTEADYVFMLDPWWNPATEAQAIDRTHRIGQTRNVMVYRLVAENTIEEKVLALQMRKAELFSALMDGGGFSEMISADDIKGLLGGEE